MVLTRQEINFRRLLRICEVRLKNNKKDDERLPKCIETLENMFHEVKNLIDPNSETMTTYIRRINLIKNELGIKTDKYDDLTERDDLFGLKHRQNKPSVSLSDDLDQVIDYHENMQRKITDDMLSLTKNLKEQSELANKIIRRDTEIVNKSTNLTEKNYSKLNVESTKLAEHTKRAWKCWMWIMLVVVMVIFINMVLFMKVMKKKL